MRATLASVLVPLALFLGTAAASASDAYPEHIATKLGLECTPGCQLCHLDSSGGPRKINSLFGANIRAEGANGNADVAGIDAALAKMATNKKDADMDRVADYDELLAGTDPNVNGGELCIGPKYGCGASTVARAASKRGIDPAATVAGSLLLVGGLLLMRRRT